MRKLTEIRELQSLRGPLHLAVGVFDGLHIGHLAVMDAARRSAEGEGGTAVVVTFDPHPGVVLASGRAPRSLTSTAHKLKLIERSAGIDTVLVVRFDAAFASLSGEEFVERLLQAAPEAGIARVCVGLEWRFGRNRSGNLALLQRLGSEHSFRVEGVDLVEFDGERISSTRVRESISRGDFALAKQLLGRPYSVQGIVVEGRRLGRTIGFPTANITTDSEQLPPVGVYAVRALDERGDEWGGVANLGFRPTVEIDETDPRLEVHLFGLDHEIYGEELEIEFISRIREERKFDGLSALKAQIALDVTAAKEILGIAVHGSKS